MNELGNISISSEVVATIADTVISGIEGAYGLSGSGSKNEIVKFLTGGSKGIEVEIGETECKLDLYIVAKYGHNLPALAGEIQRKVVEAITDMTGLKVQEVNVFVQKVIKVEEEKPVEIMQIEE